MSTNPKTGPAREPLTPLQIRGLWLAGLLIVLGSLYLLAIGRWGLWEPWETEYARMGRLFAGGGDWVNPTDPSGVPVNKPWLVTLLAQWGYQASRQFGVGMLVPLAILAVLPAVAFRDLLRERLGELGAWGVGIGVGVVLALGLSIVNGDEFWLRLPLVVLALGCLTVVFHTLARLVGTHRAGVVALILGTTPLFLMSALNLAGAMPIVATTSCALCLWALIIGERKARVDWLLFAGLLTGLAVWAGGILALVLIIGSLAVFGLWSLSETERIWREHPIPLVTGLALAVGTVVYAVIRWRVDGFEEAKNALLLVLPLGLSIAGLVAGMASRALRHVNAAWMVCFAAAALAVVLPPLFVLLDAREGADTVTFLLHNEFLNARSLHDHVTFDTLIRQVGFAAYPYTLFLPLGLAYLAQTATTVSVEVTAATSDSSKAGPLKALALCWAFLGLGIIGLSSTLSGYYIYPAMVPLSLAVGLLLTDEAFWKSLRQRKATLFLVGAGCLAVLLVLTKDLKTRSNPELGQFGPEVLFEFLLLDGREDFPEVYSLPSVRFFGYAWAACIALYFWLLLSWTLTWPESISRWLARGRANGGPGKKIGGGGRIARLILGPPLGAVSFVIERARSVVSVVRDSMETPRRFVPIMLATVVLFAGVTAMAYMPRLSDHLSTRGLIDTYLAAAQPGETFYRVGSARAGNNYYLGEETIELPSGERNPIETLRGVSDLRPFFCEPNDRIFAMIDRDVLAQAYYEIRHDEEGTECDAERNLWVLDARSSRNILVSNQLLTDRGETNQNPIAEHIFEALPDNAIVATTQYTFDNKLRLLGYRVLNEDDEVVTEAGSGDLVYLETFWEVIDKVPSAREMFIHVDYRSQRINGDHDPVGGDFPINYWVPGEIVRDRYPLTIDRGSAVGDYTINLGFFSGDTRMEVRPTVAENRITIGTIHVTGGI